MVLNDLISSPVDYTGEAVNDPHSHFDNRVDGVEDKVGYIIIERTSHLVASDRSLVFNQVDSRGSEGYAIIPDGMHANGCISRSVHISIQSHDPTTECLKLLTHFGHVTD